jgi:glycosyltransferase involved in cell wall biosynthesis
VKSTDKAREDEFAEGAPRHPTIFLSSEYETDIRLQMGRAHYSYRLVADRFIHLFRHHGYPVFTVERPEKFKTLRDLRSAFGGHVRAPIHISFRSTENIRPMPAARNVSHFAWEFDLLKDRELASGPITANQKHMLSLAQEVWVPSSHTRETLLRYGLDRTFVVPTPVCGSDPPKRLSKRAALAAIGSVPAAPLIGTTLDHDISSALLSPFVDGLGNHRAIERCLDGAGKIFLTICNPGDMRKNLLNMLDGFSLAEDGRNQDLLIVKLIVPSDSSALNTMLAGYLARRFSGPSTINRPNTLFILEYLAADQLAALYSLSDFYLSASHCEGFNLPLLEAIVHGCVPLSTCNTAMRDYIDNANSIMIRERKVYGLLRGMASDVTGASQFVSVASRFDVAAAVLRASEMSAEECARKAASGREDILERYCESAVMREVEARLNGLVAPQDSRHAV